MSGIPINPFEAPAGREDFAFVNVAEWETPADFESAVGSEEFQRLTAGIMERFPHYPGLYGIIRT